MNLLEIITNIIDDKYLFDNQKFIIEKDKDKKGKFFEMKFEIVKPQEIQYKLYRFESKDFPFFKEVKDLKKMCDFVLFAEEKNFLQVFLIELKLSPETARKQLNAANAFAKFILNSSNRVGHFLDEDKFIIKKVRICQEYVNKRNKMAVENSYNFDKDNYLDYKLKSFYLKHLMSNT